jgi:hypothetical protein
MVCGIDDSDGRLQKKALPWKRKGVNDCLPYEKSKGFYEPEYF